MSLVHILKMEYRSAESQRFAHTNNNEPIINAYTISSQLRRNDRLILEREEQIATLQEEMDNITRLNNELLWQQERNNNVLRILVDEDERRIARENTD